MAGEASTSYTFPFFWSYPPYFTSVTSAALVGVGCAEWRRDAPLARERTIWG
jgi:hypothetical protein